MNYHNPGRDGGPLYSSFTVGCLPRIEFGPGRFAAVGELVAGYGERVVLVTGKASFPRSSRFRKLVSELRQRNLAVDHIAIPGEPDPRMVDDAVRSLGPVRHAVVLAIGGGSALDAGKAIAGLATSGDSVMDYLEGVGAGRDYRGPALPLVAVPTTAGTGSEATRNAVIGRSGRGGFKKSFRDNALVPRHAVVDPDLLAGCPPEVIAANGMDALTQLIESFLSTRAGPFTDALAAAGIEAAREGLQPLHRSQGADAAARGRMAWAALASGITLAQVGLGSVHGLAAPLGALFPIPHGAACGAVLAEAVAVNIEAAERRNLEATILQRYRRVAELLGGRSFADDRQGARWLVERLRELTRELGIPGLSGFGVDESRIPELVADSRGNSMRTNPVNLDDDEIADLVRRCL